MKLETLKTIESVLVDAIMAEEAKVEAAKKKLKNALKDALNKRKIVRGGEIPTLHYDFGLDLIRTQNIIDKTFSLTGRNDIKTERERLFELFSECANKENAADRRIVELAEALREIKEISWRE